jgi:acyl-[acyl-carrier-protein]-phospholipid O-acyltransferase / long-chain-fatty-acid--[acyl-carrier-protein] ligase
LLCETRNIAIAHEPYLEPCWASRRLNFRRLRPLLNHMVAANPQVFDAKRAGTTLFAALRAAGRTFGMGKLILEDAERKPLSYKQLILSSLVLGDKLASLTTKRENVGVLLPNVNGMVVTLFGLNAFGRVAALLNFTAGTKSMTAAVQTAQIRTIITSRRFIDSAKLEDAIAALAAVGGGGEVRVLYLEDIRRSISASDKIRGGIRLLAAGAVHCRHGLMSDDPAAILFTSGTEGLPKGVVLSNRNLVCNAMQIAAHAKTALTSDDVVMNPLPMFHSFGLTAAGLMPLLHGMKTVLYPSPLHYKQVPALIRATKTTVLFATDTFLQGYGRAADDGDLNTVRVVICGAERVKDATRKLWSKWGTKLLEGYGATECSPVLACNLPANNTPGTVGTLLPGIEARLDHVDGIDEGGKLVVRGPNVMLGYMRFEAPGVIEAPEGGWHDTGDIVVIDAHGLVAIKGRAKRFAKIGGEMVSLAAVESMVAGLWPQANHVVVSIPDARKGEQLVLVTDKADADKSALLTEARAQGFADLWVPKAVLVVPQIPVLGSGKVDFQATAELARKSRPLL